MRSKAPLPALLTAAFAVVAHLVLLFAPLTCACGEAKEELRAGAPIVKACCCKPGDAPMPCKTGVPAPASEGGCASARASCDAEPPAAVSPSPQPAATLAALPAEQSQLNPSSGAVPSWAPGRELDTGPPDVPIGLVLARCSLIRV